MSRPPMLRLVPVELRKAVDTRAGLWLLVAVAAVQAALVAVAVAWGDPPSRTWSALVVYAQVPVDVLLPVLAVLLVTGEWSQRTALTTFALVPRRERVVAAKAVAVCLIALTGAATGALAGAAGFALATLSGRGTGGWHLSGVLLAQLLLLACTGMLAGTVFGLLLLRSPPAIVAMYLVPVAWSVLSRMVPGLDTVDQWLDLNRAQAPLLVAGLTGGQWARLATAATAWVLLPLALGVRRVRRAEVG